MVRDKVPPQNGRADQEGALSEASTPEGFASRVTDKRVLIILLTVAALCLLLSWLIAPSDARSLRTWLGGVALNLGAGVVGTCVTFILIDQMLHRRRSEEEDLRQREQRRADQLRADLLRCQALVVRVKTGPRDLSKGALEELRAIGWLADGSLRDVDLSGSDLRGLNFEFGDLAGAIFQGADLRGASFDRASVARASFHYADLRDASFEGADISQADFTQANTAGTTLPQ